MIAQRQSERMDLPTTSESILCKGGLLEKEAFMCHRSQQENMAYFCAQSFESDSPLLFEAGTGVGKTLAYLINAVIFAKKHVCPKKMLANCAQPNTIGVSFF